RDPDERADEAHMVEEAAVALRREKAERDPEDDREDHRRERKLDRRRETMRKLVRDCAATRDGDAEIEVPDRLQIAPVLLVDRRVELVLVPDLRDELRRRPLAEQRLRRRARQQPDPPEDEDREPEKDRDEQEQPTDDEAKHLIVRRPCPWRHLLTFRNGRWRTAPARRGSACSPAPSSGTRAPASSARTGSSGGTS